MIFIIYSLIVFSLKSATSLTKCYIYEEKWAFGWQAEH